ARPPAALRVPRPSHCQGPLRAHDGRHAGEADHLRRARSVRSGRCVCEGASMTIDEIMRTAPVIPVLVLEGNADWAKLAATFVGAGLPVLEVTLRTPQALDAIRAMREVPGAIVGAGTVVNERQLNDAIDAGSQFIVSPGLTEPLGRAVIQSGVPYP